MRLVLDEVNDDDLGAMVEVFQSNPEFLDRREGTSGVVGLYDRSKLGRDLAVAAVDPAREMLAVRTQRGMAPIGVVDLLRKHPDDGIPWLGVVVIHTDQQREGYGREVVSAIVSWMRDELRATVIDAAVDEDDEQARAFLSALGFEEVRRRWRRGPNGEVVVSVQERATRGAEP